MSNIIKGEELNEIELEKNTTEHTVMLHCQDGYSDCSVELSKDKAIELANKILEMCGEKLPVNISDLTSLENPMMNKTYLDKLEDKLYTETGAKKQFFEGYKPQYYFKTDNNKVCENCGCNPKNGGSGNCNCTLASPTIH